MQAISQLMFPKASRLIFVSVYFCSLEKKLKVYIKFLNATVVSYSRIL